MHVLSSGYLTCGLNYKYGAYFFLLIPRANPKIFIFPVLLLRSGQHS